MTTHATAVFPDTWHSSGVGGIAKVHGTTYTFTCVITSVVMFMTTEGGGASPQVQTPSGYFSYFLLIKWEGVWEIGRAHV